MDRCTDRKTANHFARKTDQQETNNYIVIGQPVGNTDGRTDT